MIVRRCKDIQEFKDFHKQYANERIPSAESILRNWDYHFCFYDEETLELLGCIYLEDEDGKIMLSGFSKPKQIDKVLEAIHFVSTFMAQDVLYSRTDRKSAKLVLLRAGFEKIDNELFIRKVA